ncbi:hypothetical protein BHYA_0392g00040 [Botrytis hyacinthi]|uniref:Uncharacterized protein n=1 Tax=Botrytis hyacinthi TaxID=278943 RepID=A0A4Z1G8T0_9HELO|nr:hypothetical protein BHYA_0392g00040 [Botrytis hyacinthi]
MRTRSMTPRIHTVLMSPHSLNSLAPSPTLFVISPPLISHLFATYGTVKILDIKNPVAWFAMISDASENSVVFGFVFDLAGAFGSVDGDVHFLGGSLEKIVEDGGCGDLGSGDCVAFLDRGDW